MIQVAHIGDSAPPLHQQINYFEPGDSPSQQQLDAAHQIIKINHSNHIKTLNSANDGRSFFKKFSAKFLIIFAICAVVTIVVCSILIAVMTVQFFINSKIYDRYKDNIHNEHLNGGNLPVFETNPSTFRETNDNNINHNNTKTERNSFNNWIKNSFGKKIFGLNMDNFYQTSHYPGCGKPLVDPQLVYTRIMHGKEAVPNSWPYAVSIAFQGPRDSVPHACGGTLINKRYILTAAHCVHKNSIYSLVGSPVRNSEKYDTVEKMMRIYVGIHDRVDDLRQNKIYGVETIKVHYRFDPETFKNDLALVKLDRDVEISSQVGFVCVSKTAHVVPGDSIYAVGWGYTENSRNQASRNLMQVDLIVQRKDTCLIEYDDQDQFCAGNVFKKKDTCNGDSGGSLMKLVNNRWTIMGVVSNGDISCGGTGIYINVPYFYDWITANSQD